jgi:hypothetical protein
MSAAGIQGRLVAVSSVLGLAAACNALWGIDELAFDGAGAEGATAGSGGATSTTSSGRGGAGGAGNAGGAAGAGACGQADCGDCSTSLCSTEPCGDELAACAATPGCQNLADCMQLCPPSAAVCQSQCIAAHPDAVITFYQLFECTSCQSETCSALCDAMCDGGCTTGATSCNECINAPCAQTVCEAPLAACGLSCTSFASCIDACGHDDTPCHAACVQGNESGAELYNAVIQCTVCTKPACWDLCGAEGASCRGYTAE